VELPTRASLERAMALVRGVLEPTPQIAWPLLCARLGCEAWVKHENALPTGAFKVRGGLVLVERLAREGVRGVVAATRGNHGQSVAFAARRFGLTATIYVPRGNSPAKNAAMQAFGATLVEHGRDFQEALELFAATAPSRRRARIPSPTAWRAGCPFPKRSRSCSGTRRAWCG
jgi:threonine dehydratase